MIKPFEVGGSVCLVEHETLSYFYFDIKYRKTLHSLEGIHQQIVLERFDENLTILRAVDSNLGAHSKFESAPPGKARFF